MDIAWAYAGPAMHKVNWGEKMGPRIREDKGGFCGYEGGGCGLGEGENWAWNGRRDSSTSLRCAQNDMWVEGEA